jgi:undecaprenyl-diphosphatase
MSNAVSTKSPIIKTGSVRPFVIAATLGAFVFVVMAIVLRANGGVNSFDTSVATWFTDSRSGALESLGKLIASLTTPFILVAVTVIAAVVLWARSRRHDAVILAGSVFIAYLFGAIAKKLEGRARPLAPINLSPESEPSFPSGHVLVVTTIAFVALGLAWAYLDRTARIAWTTVAVVVVAMVSLDRLVVGAHWFTDVVGSLALACAIGSCAMIVRKNREAQSAKD